MSKAIFLLVAATTAMAQAGEGGGSSGGGGGGGASSSKTVLIAHVVCGALATMLFLPIGMLIPRYARAFTTRRWWWFAHTAVMGVLGFAFAIAAIAIARVKLQGEYDSLHGSLGLALVCLVSFQVLLGIILHFVNVRIPKLQTSSGRGPTNFLHIIAGWATVAVGFVTAWEGMVTQWKRKSGSGAAGTGYYVAFGVIVGFTGLAYIAGLLLVPRQLRLAKEESKKDGIPKGELATGHDMRPARNDGAQRI